MKDRIRIGVTTAFALIVGCTSVGNAGSPAQVTTSPIDEIDWTVLPDGRSIATVHGDRQTGEHITLVRFPAGLRTAIHKHSNTYDGTIVHGSARHFEPQLEASARWLVAGSVYRVPANIPHISECSDEADCIFAIHQHGAFDRTVVE